LGAALFRLWNERYHVRALTREDVDISDPDALRKRLTEENFDILVNCAAQASLEYCEDHPEDARAVNTKAPAVMAEVCTEKGVRMMHVSTDYVFDGLKSDAPYVEEDEASPVSIYGWTKLDGEKEVLSAHPLHVVMRVSWLFGPDKPSFVDILIDRALKDDSVEAIGDKTSSPTYADDVALWMEAFFSSSRKGGLYHACNSGGCSWRDFAEFAIRQAADCGAPIKTRDVDFIPMDAMKSFSALRPLHTVMSTEKLAKEIGIPMRPWQEAVAAYVRVKFPEKILV